MPEVVMLNSAQEIRQWQEEHPARTRRAEERIEGADLEVNLISYKLVRKPGKRVFYGVQHLFYATDGSVLVKMQRVFQAVDAEEALQMYFHEAEERESGAGEDYVSFKIYDNPTYEPQEIRVLKLAEGTDKFIQPWDQLRA